MDMKLGGGGKGLTVWGIQQSTLFLGRVVTIYFLARAYEYEQSAKGIGAKKYNIIYGIIGGCKNELVHYQLYYFRSRIEDLFLV